MWMLITFIYVQQGLDVQITDLKKGPEYRIESECWERTSFETKVLPLQVGDDARWQYATCVKVRS